MNRKVSLGFTLALMLLVAAVTFTVTFDQVTNMMDNRVTALRERESAQAKYAEIDREVRANYGGAIDESALLDSVARGYLAGIGDPYATYYDARTYERILRAGDNSVADIGALIQANPGGDGYLLVVEVYPDSPALSADIKPGDLIIRIDEQDLTPENSVRMLESIQGESGTRITLVVRSGNTDRTEELTRREVPVPSVYSRMLGDSRVGYMLIKEFNKNTPDQFKRERDKLISAGAQSIVFDLRDNPGGLIKSAAKILDMMVPTGVLVSSIDKNNNATVMESSDAYELNLPMVVLVNGGTASSAEIFAQVLRDYDKARIVGVQTRGKGVIQSLIKLADGSAIEITVAKLVTPGGDVFDGIGIKPDYDVTIDGAWQNLDETSDPQLRKAIEVAVGMHKTGEALAEQSKQEDSSTPQESVSPRPEPSVTPEPSEENVPEENQSSAGEEDTDDEEESDDDEESGDEDDSDVGGEESGQGANQPDEEEE